MSRLQLDDQLRGLVSPRRRTRSFDTQRKPKLASLVSPCEVSEPCLIKGLALWFVISKPRRSAKGSQLGICQLDRC